MHEVQRSDELEQNALVLLCGLFYRQSLVGNPLEDVLRNVLHDFVEEFCIGLVAQEDRVDSSGELFGFFVHYLIEILDHVVVGGCLHVLCEVIDRLYLFSNYVFEAKYLIEAVEKLLGLNLLGLIER